MVVGSSQVGGRSINWKDETWKTLFPSTNVFFFGILTFFTRTDQPFLVELKITIEPCYKTLSQTTLIRCLTFLLRSMTVTLTTLLFWIYLFIPIEKF